MPELKILVQYRCGRCCPDGRVMEVHGTCSGNALPAAPSPCLCPTCNGPALLVGAVLTGGMVPGEVKLSAVPQEAEPANDAGESTAADMGIDWNGELPDVELKKRAKKRVLKRRCK